MKYHQPYGVSDPNAPYINGNPSTGTMGSIPPAESIEQSQRELARLIADARMTPSDGDLNQVSKAIQSGQLIYADDAGTQNAIQLITSPNIGNTFVKGFTVITRAANTNTGQTTVTINGAGIWPVVHSNDFSVLNSNDINAGQMLALCFDGTNFQLVWSARIPGLPTYLTAPRHYYVNATGGNDTYDGQSAVFSSGIHGPFATLQKASDQIPLFNLNGYSITVHVADGSYAPVTIRQSNGSGNIYWIGNVSNPAAVVINGANSSAVIFIDTGTNMTMEGFKLTSYGTGTYDALVGIIAAGSGTCTLGQMEFGPCQGAMMSVQRNALVTNKTAGVIWTISGGSSGNAYHAGYFLAAFRGGNFIQNISGGPSLNITTPSSFGGGFIVAFTNAFVELLYTSIAGYSNVSGKKFEASYNSAINTGGGGVNYYPGTVAGVISNGSYYT